MSNKTAYLIGGTIGGIAGGYLPSLWGASEFSGWAILLSTVFGLVGIWLTYKLINR